MFKSPFIKRIERIWNSFSSQCHCHGKRPDHCERNFDTSKSCKAPFIFRAKAALIIGLVLIFCLPQPARSDFKKTKVAVLDFELQGKGFETKDMGAIVSEWLITALVKKGRFDVIERNLLKKIVQEHKLVMTGIVDQKNASELGKLLGVKVIISGTVMRLQDIIEVNARIIDVQSASIITAEIVKSTSAARLEDLVVQMAEKIIKDFPLEGYIVHKDEKKVVIDLGKRAGVEKTMQFVVFREGNVIKHPKTGEVLDVEKIRTGVVEITSVSDKISNCKIIKEEKPGAIEYGQMVKSLRTRIASTKTKSRPKKQVSKDKPKRTKSPSEVLPSTKTSQPLAWYTPPKSPIMQRLSRIDPMLSQMKKMKKKGNNEWKSKSKEVFSILKPIYKQNPTSPEVFFYYARAYHIYGSARKTYKSLEKALYYNPEFIAALIFKGDVCYQWGKENTSGRKKKKYETLAIQAYEAAAYRMKQNRMKAFMYLNIGNVYADVSGNHTNAKEYWEKAVSTSPGSKAAGIARQRLGK